MATATIPGAAGEFASAPSSVKDALYNRCATRPPGTLFFQEDLVEMSLTKDLNELMTAVQTLVDSHLFLVYNHDGHICWKLRSREDGAKLSTLTPDERLLYTHIETAGNGGIWTKILRNKTLLPQSTLTKCLKILESRSLVKSITSVKTPARKLYILAHLDPADEVTGGAWHSDGELDMGMISEVSRVVLMYVRSRSWGSQAPQPVYIAPDGGTLSSATPSSARKAHAASIAAAGGATPTNKKFRPPAPTAPSSSSASAPTIIPRGPSYAAYPTAADIATFIASNNILKGIALAHSDLSALLDMLVYDGALERVAHDAFRTARTLQPRDLEDWTADQRRDQAAVSVSGPGPTAGATGGTGLSQAPCGRCPVFALCEEGGPVSASNCVYFEEWLRPWLKKGGGEGKGSRGVEGRAGS